MLTPWRNLPQMPEIGHPESYYAQQIHHADKVRNAHWREASKVGQYITLALDPRLEWEKKLQTLSNKRAVYTKADYDTLVPLMYRIAAIAQPTEAFAPEPMGKKTPDEWIKLSREMGTEALAAADLAKKPKPEDKMVKAAVKKVEATCTSCHDKYRDTK